MTGRRHEILEAFEANDFLAVVAAVDGDSESQAESSLDRRVLIARAMTGDFAGAHALVDSALGEGWAEEDSPEFAAAFGVVASQVLVEFMQPVRALEVLDGSTVELDQADLLAMRGRERARLLMLMGEPSAHLALPVSLERAGSQMNRVMTAAARSVSGGHETGGSPLGGLGAATNMFLHSPVQDLRWFWLAGLNLADALAEIGALAPLDDTLAALADKGQEIPPEFSLAAELSAAQRHRLAGDLNHAVTSLTACRDMLPGFGPLTENEVRFNQARVSADQGAVDASREVLKELAQQYETAGIRLLALKARNEIASGPPVAKPYPPVWHWHLDTTHPIPRSTKLSRAWRVLPESVESSGGIYRIAQSEHTPSEIAQAMELNNVRGLELVSFRDLSFLKDLPPIEHLYLRTDGRPDLEPLTHLTQLQTLDLRVGSVRGTPDLSALSDLRYLSVPGGKRSAELLDTLHDGHSRLQFLSSDTKPRSIRELGGPFPKLVSLRLWGEGLRSVEMINESMPKLRRLHLSFGMNLKSLAGLESLKNLETLFIEHGFEPKDLDLLMKSRLRTLGDINGDGSALVRHPTIQQLGATDAGLLPDHFTGSLPRLIAATDALTRKAFFHDHPEAEQAWTAAIEGGWHDIT